MLRVLLCRDVLGRGLLDQSNGQSGTLLDSLCAENPLTSVRLRGGIDRSPVVLRLLVVLAALAV